MPVIPSTSGTGGRRVRNSRPCLKKEKKKMSQITSMFPATLAKSQPDAAYNVMGSWSRPTGQAQCFCSPVFSRLQMIPPLSLTWLAAAFPPACLLYKRGNALKKALGRLCLLPPPGHCPTCPDPDAKKPWKEAISLLQPLLGCCRGQGRWKGSREDVGGQVGGGLFQAQLPPTFL